MQVETGTADEIQEKYTDRTIYALTLTENQQSGLKGGADYSWNPLLPYSFPLGGISIQDSSNGRSNSLYNPLDDIQRNNISAPPSEGSNNNNQFNQSATPP